MLSVIIAFTLFSLTLLLLTLVFPAETRRLLSSGSRALVFGAAFAAFAMLAWFSRVLVETTPPDVLIMMAKPVCGVVLGPLTLLALVRGGQMLAGKREAARITGKRERATFAAAKRRDYPWWQETGAD